MKSLVVNSINDLKGVKNEYFELDVIDNNVVAYSKITRNPIMSVKVKDLKYLADLGFDIKIKKKKLTIDVLMNISKKTGFDIIIRDGNIYYKNDYWQIININDLLEEYGYYIEKEKGEDNNGN